MKTIRFGLVILLAALAVTGVASAAEPTHFHAVLTGAQEVPPRDTPARGEVTVIYDDVEETLRFRLVAKRIENVFAAHIHCAPPGENGPVGVTLFMGAPNFSPEDGIRARGTLTAPDPGNGCGWTTIADVVAAMRSGDTYVNVHTNDGIDPPNTGPGDFPGGEIRGQLMPLGENR